MCLAYSEDTLKRGSLKQGKIYCGRSASPICNLFCFVHSFPKTLVTYIKIFLIWFLLWKPVSHSKVPPPWRCGIWAFVLWRLSGHTGGAPWLVREVTRAAGPTREAVMNASGVAHFSKTSNWQFSPCLPLAVNLSCLWIKIFSMSSQISVILGESTVFIKWLWTFSVISATNWSIWCFCQFWK